MNTPRAMVDRILRGDGKASPILRAHAFNNQDLPEPLRGLIDKVATRSMQVTDADFAGALAAGFSDDELFELVISAAVGAAKRRYDAGFAALGQATADQRGV